LHDMALGAWHFGSYMEAIPIDDCLCHDAVLLDAHDAPGRCYADTEITAVEKP